MTTHAAPIRAFLSYARADDEEFGIVDPLVRKLKAFVKAKSGRTLEVFVDRDSIGWGEDWRDRLSESVEAATVFLPLLSATYLDREACREEFLAFHSKAEVLGVTELLLPILLFKSPLFGPESTDELVQLAERRQYRCIEDGLLSGYGSPKWLTATKDLADSLISALAKAETALESGGRPASARTVRLALGASTPVGTDELPEDDEDDGLGLAELTLAMNETVEQMTAAAEPLAPAIEALGQAVQNHEFPDDATPTQFKVWSLNLARSLQAPANSIEAHGKELFRGTKALDEVIDGIRTLAGQISDPELREPIETGLRKVVKEFGDLSEVESMMDSMLTSMEPAEVMSVPIRKALRPARRGLTSIRDSLRMILSWDLDSQTAMA